MKHLESNESETDRSRILKNSLLSSNAQESNLNDFDKDTVYSFFAEESEIIPRRQKRAGQRDHERNNRHNFAKKTNTVDEEQTSFIASQSPKEYKRKKPRTN